MSWLTESVNDKAEDNEEVWDKYLTSTSYYKAAHTAISKCIDIVKPKHVLDCGCSIGVSLMMLAEEYPHIEFSGLEESNDLAFIASNVAANYRNIDRIYIDRYVVDFIMDYSALFDFTYMLYQFRHIGVTTEDKFKFLEGFYEAMKPGSYLCIADTLLDDIDYDNIDSLYKHRADEVYASVLLSCISSFNKEKVEEHKIFAANASYKELAVGKIIKEQHDTLISKFLLTTEAKRIGYNVLFAEQVNGIGDYVILLQK